MCGGETYVVDIYIYRQLASPRAEDLKGNCVGTGGDGVRKNSRAAADRNEAARQLRRENHHHHVPPRPIGKSKNETYRGPVFRTGL